MGMSQATEAANSPSVQPGRTVLFRDLPPGAASSATGTDVFSLDAPIIITIDGPAGTGKSSVARAVANRLGLDFLDTGAMYRVAAAIAIDRAIPLTDPDRLVATVRDAEVRFNWKTDPPAVLAWGQPLGDRIRRADVTAIVSRVASIAALRHLMVQKQRAIAKDHPRLVSEGRDQGSIVFPDAHVKFYLDASAQVRASRRAQQLAEAGQPVDEARLLRDIIDRDNSDMSRSDGPLIRPDGGIVVDTSSLQFDEVVEELERIVRRKAVEP
jgi:cytidylate kinase